MTISIILPSTGREEQLHDLLTIMESVLPDGGEIVVVLDRNDIVDRDKYDAVGRLLTTHLRTRFIVTTVCGASKCSNIALEHARHDLILWAGDDARPHDGWFEKGMACFNRHFPDGLGLSSFNDLYSMGQIASYSITTRRFLNVLFGYPHFPPEFHHAFVDTLVRNRAVDLGRYHFCEGAVMEHVDWHSGKSARDATSKRGAGEVKRSDKEIKDAMDQVWMHQGGFQEARDRLREAK